MSGDGLFQKYDLRSVLQSQTQTAIADVSGAAREELQFSTEAVTERILDRRSVDVPVVDWASPTRTGPVEATIKTRGHFDDREFKVAAQRLTISWPYEGDQKLFYMRASTFGLSGFHHDVDVRPDSVSLTITERKIVPADVVARIERFKEQIEGGLGWVRTDVTEWEAQFRTSVQAATERRLADLNDLAALGAALEIPLKGTEQSAAVQVPVSRKRVKPTASRAASSAGDPVISQAIYNDVIATVMSFTGAAERLPRTAAKFSETEWRDLILFMLNANYEGAARGEVFNGDGKTDILLPWQDRNAFIGECKVWRGAGGLTDAIDQLLGYTVWRDTKAALILFIKTGEPTSIIKKCIGAITAHPAFVSAKPSTDLTARSDYLMHSTIDNERMIQVAFLPVIIQRTTATTA